MANYKVLIIDDAFFIRNLIKKAIAKKPMTKGNTFEVIGEAQDGRAGIDLCASLNPDIITVDFNIPTINGLDFAKYLKELHPNIPVIMISSNLDPDFSKKVSEARCRLLTKPFQEAYLWKVLDDVVDEILNSNSTVVKSKIDQNTQKVLDELAAEFNGEIVPLKDERKDISSQGLADKNIQQGKAKNVGFDYSGEVLEIKTGRRRMSSDILLDTEKPVEKPIPEQFVPEIPFANVENDVDLEDEDDYVIDLDAIENQRESEYGKTGIEELEDEEFFFIEDEDDENTSVPATPVVQQETLLLDITKLEDIAIFDDDDDNDVFLVDDAEDDEEFELGEAQSPQAQKCEVLLNTVTFNYYDYLGTLLAAVQNKPVIKVEVQKQEEIDETPKPILREETADEEFDRLFNEFNGQSDIQLENDAPKHIVKELEKNIIQEETVLNRGRERISVDPPKDNNVYRIYGSKLANVTASEDFIQIEPEQPEEVVPPKKKGFFAKLLDKIFRRK